MTTTIAAVSGVEEEESGLASGLINTSQQVGGALGLAILSTIATSHTEGLVESGHGLKPALTDGFQIAFLGGAAFAARRHRPDPGPDQEQRQPRPRRNRQTEADAARRIRITDRFSRI